MRDAAQSPPSLTSLGECLLSLQQYNEAINVLEQCIRSFPKHPESYRARLLASIAYREKRVPEEKTETTQDAAAESQVDSNVETPRQRNLARAGALDGQPAPYVLNTSQSLLEAIEAGLRQAALSASPRAGTDRLSDAQTGAPPTVLRTSPTSPRAWPNWKPHMSCTRRQLKILTRWWNGKSEMPSPRRMPDSSEARYYLAEARQHSANFKEQSLDIEKSQSRRIALRQELRDYLQQAADDYGQLKDQLARKQTHTDLSPKEQRNFAQFLFRLCRYPVQTGGLRCGHHGICGSHQLVPGSTRGPGSDDAVRRLLSKTEPGR